VIGFPSDLPGNKIASNQQMIEKNQTLNKKISKSHSKTFNLNFKQVSQFFRQIGRFDAILLPGSVHV